MLDLALIRSEPERVTRALARRGVAADAVEAVLDLDERWTERQEVREALRLRRRRAAEEVARARTEGRTSEPFEAAGRQVAEELAQVERQAAALEAARAQALLALPNLPATDAPPDAPEPAAEAAGHHQAPTPPPWPKPFPPLHHADLVATLGLAATAGSAGHGFIVWRGRGARLIRALTDFMLDVHTREFGFEEVRAPAPATREALFGSAHLPLLAGKIYRVDAAPLAGDAAKPEEQRGAGAPLFLAPRAEPHLAGLYAGQVLDASRLPVRLVAAGPAFRREAGGGGAAARGLVRLHQFDTVELYIFAAPEQGEEELARAADAAEAIPARLGLPHRRRPRAARALSHAAAKTIDIDVWSPGMRAEQRADGTRASSEGTWLPVAAISAFTDYQARRTNTRYRSASGRARLVHTLGGAAVALPHLVAALLESGQEADGSVRLPPALAGYVGQEVLHAAPADES
ncbi:MAG: serine--tRNA ligase [Planctomycetes bacterium]|nr:serine--tRNA ligase [Planctomycetota bacterium]